jgi:hypothetical protein
MRRRYDSVQIEILMKIFLFDSYTMQRDTLDQARLRQGVVDCGGRISHVSTGVQWHLRGNGYEAFGVFDRDEDAVAFKLRYL